MNKNKLHIVMQKVIENKEQNFEMFYRECKDYVFKIVFSIIKNKDDSEDIMQNLFLKLYKIPENKFPTKSEASWLYAVAKNETLNYIKAKKDDGNNTLKILITNLCMFAISVSLIGLINNNLEKESNESVEIEESQDKTNTEIGNDSMNDDNIAEDNSQQSQSEQGKNLIEGETDSIVIDNDIMENFIENSIQIIR